MASWQPRQGPAAPDAQSDLLQSLQTSCQQLGEGVLPAADGRWQAV